MSNISHPITEDKEQQVVRNLNLYLFRNVWNDVYRALRNNVLPQMLGKRSFLGNIRVYGDNLPLPKSNTPYYLYAAAAHSVKALGWPKYIDYQWIPTSELLNEHDLLFDVYHIHGKMLHKEHVYIYCIPHRSVYLIAVDKKMANTFLKHEDMDGIRFTTYHDYDSVHKLSVHSYTLPSNADYRDKSAVLDKYIELSSYVHDDVPGTVSVKPAVTMIVNGTELQPADIGSIPSDSYVDIILDENVHIDIEVDLSDPQNDVAYFSEMDQCYKNIIHIPRVYNTENFIVSHNAVEFYIRKKAKEPDGSIKGLYMHRCAERSVTQLTHQDFSIPSYILDAYKDYLGTSEVTIRLMWRKHENINTLIRDKNYIDLLYQNLHNDREIIGFLSNSHPFSKEIKFWSAQHLEASEYMKMIYDVPEVLVPSNMHTYIEALGYYNTMYILSKHIHKNIVTDSYQGAYMYDKPLVYQGNPVHPLVYANGRKLAESQITVSNDTDEAVVIGINPTHTPVGTLLTVELHRTGNTEMYRITPDATSTSLTLPATEYDIIERFTNTVPTSAYDHVTNYTYELFEQHAGNIVRTTQKDGTYKLSFGSSMFGRTFFIQPRPRTLYMSSYEYLDNLDLQAKIDSESPLVFPLEYRVMWDAVGNTNGYVTDGDRALIWDTDSMMIYVNGRYLIRDIDYTIEEHPGYDGKMAMKVLCIYNYSYLSSIQENTLEIYSTSAVDENREIGYCATKKKSQFDESTHVAASIVDNRTVLYNDGATIVHVNGYYTEPEIMGNYITKKESWSYGDWKPAQPIEVRTSVPYFVSDYLKKFHVNDDFERIELLNKYYYNTDLLQVDMEVIEQSHQLYSPYVSTILRDVLTGNTDICYDADAERMIDQLEQYNYLRERDITMLPIEESKLDLMFVDIYPHYKDIIAPDIEMYRLLHAIIRICMKDDPLSSKKDVDLKQP